jgi:hypothetical protein
MQLLNPDSCVSYLVAKASKLSAATSMLLTARHSKLSDSGSALNCGHIVLLVGFEVLDHQLPDITDA